MVQKEKALINSERKVRYETIIYIYNQRDKINEMVPVPISMMF